MINRIAIIPARSGSKRIPDKNIKLFYNKPIISYAIKTLKESKLFNEIHVSTNSFNIKDIVEKFSLKIPFIRPNYLSKDSTPLIEVINYVLDKYAKKKIYFDEVWLIYSTAVLLDVKDLQKAANLLRKKKIQNLITVSKYPAPIEWAYKIKKDYLIPINKKNIIKDSKLFEEKYYENATFIAYKVNKHQNYVNKISNFVPFELPLWKSADIDVKEDWELLKKLYLAKKIFNK